MADTENLILTVHKAKIATSNVVKIRPDAQKVLQEIQSETGLSASYIVSEMIKFSQDKIRVEVVE